jgi:hypothetical protein
MGTEEDQDFLLRNNVGGVVSTLRNMQKALRQWSQEPLSAVTEELAGLRRELEEIKSRIVVCRADMRAIMDHVDELLFLEEKMWLQRSRISWLREGVVTQGFFTVRQSGGRGRI